MPTLRAGSAIVTTGAGTATTLSFTVPSGTAVGDTIGIWLFTGLTSRTFSATGYTYTAATNPGSASASGGLLFKTAVIGDLGGSVTVTISGAATVWAGTIFAVLASSGFDPSTADGGQISTSASSVSDSNTNTTLLNGDLVMWPGGCRSGAGGGTPATITPPSSATGYSGFSTVVAQSSTTHASVVNVGIILAKFTQTSAGNTGTASIQGSLSVSEANACDNLTFGDTAAVAKTGLLAAWPP